MKRIITVVACCVVSLFLFVNDCDAKKKQKSKKASSEKQSGKGGIFSGLTKAKHIFGPKVTADDLKGKVVFLEYWGINCPPCRASYPHLVKLQNKYSKTGKFTVLASHVQNYSKNVTKFLSQQKVTFPVYQQLRVSAAPCGRGIPHAALIDHTGKVVAAGYPSDLYSKVAALVKAAPHPIIGDMKIVFCKTQAKSLESGKVAAALKTLEKLSNAPGEKGEEAKALLKHARDYLAERKESLMEKASTEPSAALDELTEFAKLVNGLEYSGEVNAKIAELKKDPSLKKLIKFRKDIEKLEEKLAKKESSSTKKALNKIKEALQKFIDDDKTTPAVAEEAKSLL